MSIGRGIGLHLSRALVRSNAGIFGRGVSVAAIKHENGGKADSGWKLYPTDPSEEVRQEPWLKAAMDTLNRELMRQGTRIRGQYLE